MEKDMKKSRFTEGQMLAILKQGENGVPVADFCREHGISNATYYNWRSKYGGMDASLMSEMKAMVEENRRLNNETETGCVKSTYQSHEKGDDYPFEGFQNCSFGSP
jgi:putative transposase